MESCKDCRFFKPEFYSLGYCTRQRTPGSKIFADEGKAILVHITFGCNQFAPVPETEKETI